MDEFGEPEFDDFIDTRGIIVDELKHSGKEPEIEMKALSSATGMYMVVNINEDLFYLGWLDDSLDCYSRWLKKDLDVSDLDGNLFMYLPMDSGDDINILEN